MERKVMKIFKKFVALIVIKNPVGKFVARHGFLFSLIVMVIGWGSGSGMGILSWFRSIATLLVAYFFCFLEVFYLYDDAAIKYRQKTSLLSILIDVLLFFIFIMLQI